MAAQALSRASLAVPAGVLSADYPRKLKFFSFRGYFGIVKLSVVLRTDNRVFTCQVQPGCGACGKGIPGGPTPHNRGYCWNNLLGHSSAAPCQY